ncbi:MAG: hypothetical protein ABWY09_16185, partial [Stenotrophomonas maltophilia]
TGKRRSECDVTQRKQCFHDVPPGSGADNLASNLIPAMSTQAGRTHPASTHHRVPRCRHGLQRNTGRIVERHISPRPVMEE